MGESQVKNNEYYVGLDIGTHSVGWAVTTKAYNIKKFNGKSMQGVRMFDEMKTAEMRRIHRSSRRRLARRKDRLNLLQAYFKDEIDKIDPHFFTRLDEGFLQDVDRTVKRVHTLFDDKDFNDKDFYKRYKTIYHLRNELVTSTEKHDIRLVYLAIHHIMKSRGHFLFEGELDSQGNITELLENLNQLTENIFGINVYELNSKESQEAFQAVLLNPRLNRTNRYNEIKKFTNPIISKTEKHFEEIHKMISARSSNLANLFFESELEKDLKIDFYNDNLDEKLEELNMLNDEEYKLVEVIKGIYDWSLLQKILDGKSSISASMQLSYEKHKAELETLKKLIEAIEEDGEVKSKKEYKDTDKRPTRNNYYQEFFKDKEKKGTYAYYAKGDNKHIEEVYKTLKKILELVPAKYSEDVEFIKLEMENKNYLLKQRISTNSVIPHQLHHQELRLILKNASAHYPFLDEIDHTELSIRRQLSEIFKFRVPYYIGPLNDTHQENGFSWVVRKEKGKVYPWNFEDKIDVEKTAEQFIRNMTNKCTYILDADVLPKSSLLYEKYMVLNEINNLKINGNDIDVEMKQDIYEELFVKTKRIVTKNSLSKYIKNNYSKYFNEEVVITGIDDRVKSQLKSLHSFKTIFNDELPSDEVLENIILWSTLYSDEKSMLVNKINEEYPNQFTKEQLDKIKKVVFKDWGRLSRELLENVIDNYDQNEPRSIIQMLFASNYNLMELLSSKFTYQKQIDKHNEEHLERNDGIRYDMLEGLNLPANTKRSIWQTIRLTEEIKSILKSDPSRVFIEMAREDGIKGQRTSSRKEQLLRFYKDLDNDTSLLDSLKSHLDAENDDSLRKRKVYLYYKQLGRCAYTNEVINFDDLMDNNKYDIDHIYPQSVTADDSLVNQVLCVRDANSRKSDEYPIKTDIQSKMYGLWYQLKESGLMEKETFFRLTRRTALTDDELANFVARQLVETRQSTKGVLTMMKKIYPNSEVITIKAKHIDEFRHQNKIIKVRSLNDLHHAKDAYLSIVVGNVYHEKFTADPRNFIRTAKKRSYNLLKMFDTENNNNHVASRATGELVWESGPEGTIKKVRKNLKNNDVQTTYMIQERSGELFDQNPVGKDTGKADSKIELKKGMSTERYGGYNKAKYGFYTLIEYKRGKKLIRKIEPIHLLVKDQIKNDDDLKNHIMKLLGIKDVRIIIPYIPSINTLLEFDGGRHRITGVSGVQFLLRNEVQPFFEERFIEIWKKVDGVMTQDKQYLISRITENDCEYLYQMIKEKLILENHKVRLRQFYSLIELNYETYTKLSINDKVKVCWELLKLVKSTRESSDLSLIGGTKISGTNYLGMTISNKEEIYLVNQSVTGLFENKINLLEL